MATPTEQWNRGFMAVEKDISINAIPRHRYAVLSVPRSGSTLLARGLQATGELGMPLEYLNPNAISAWCYERSIKQPKLWEYLTRIESTRTSPMGWFGIKAHYRHFEHHFEEDAFLEAVAFVKQNDFCIFITRRDVIAQAVSYYRARSTGLWSSEHKGLLPRDASLNTAFDVIALDDCYEEVLRGEKMWRQVLEHTEQKYLHVVFEDLTSDYHHEMRRVFEYLQMPHLRIPEMQLEPVAKEFNDGLVEMYRKHRENIG